MKEAVNIQQEISQVIITELGSKNIVRVEVELGSDSYGRDAHKILVVITPEAIKNFKNDATLDVLGKLWDWLNEMDDERLPLVSYATEAELLDDSP